MLPAVVGEANARDLVADRKRKSARERSFFNIR
jgi:hypothetical protein